MMRFPLPKTVLHKVEAICRAFVSTGTEKNSKIPVAWNQVCRPIKQDGLNLINMKKWNQVAMLKCLWSLSMKLDNSWVKWVHTYYLKKETLWNVILHSTRLWIMNDIMARREDVTPHQ